MEGIPQKKEEVPLQKLQSLKYEAILTENGAEFLEHATEIEPVKVDEALYSELNTKLQKRLMFVVLNAIEYIHGPIFLDSFGADIGKDPYAPDGRRTAQGKLLEKYGEEFNTFCGTNRLKAGRMTGLLMAMEYLKDELPKNETHSLRLQNLEVILDRALKPFEPVTGFNEKYRNHAELPERLEYVHQLTNSAEEFLEFVQEKEEKEMRKVA